MDGARSSFLRRAVTTPVPALTSQKSGPAQETQHNNIKVCVRVRPFAEREAGETLCVQMPTDTQVVMTDSRKHQKPFELDRCYWSHEPKAPNFASQDTLMEELGNEILTNVKDGFNNCLFAYGQTGSGKTHSVLGNEDNPHNRGLLPRIIEKLFEEIDQDQEQMEEVSYRCKVSYLEIYNEHIRDLLVPPDKRDNVNLPVRQHKKLGCYVPGLTENAVTKYKEVKKMIDFGAKTRVVAATNMNAGSSRSHCIFIFYMDKESVVNGRKSQLRARVNLVDLAGSERVEKTGSTGDRLKEGAKINQSLSNLATVINKLAESSTDVLGNSNTGHIPYRNSKLTYLLQESLSGNSKTVMMAAISPALSNYEETLSTLRFAQTCKQIVTHVHKNEESSESIISDLQLEILKLKAAIANCAGDNPDLEQRLQESLGLRAKVDTDFNAELAEAKKREQEREKALEGMGLSFDAGANNVKMDSNVPMLVNISEDPSLSGCLVYFLPPEDETLLGQDESCKIILQGLGIKKFMCAIHNQDNKVITLWLLTPDGEKIEAAQLVENHIKEHVAHSGEEAPGRVLVNGRFPGSPRELHHMDRIILGHAFCFRVTKNSNTGDRRRSLYEAVQTNLAEVLHEVVHDDTPAFMECRAMLDSIQDRIGVSRCNKFLTEFKTVLPLVEEGNLITSELRGGDFLRFQIEVCSDVMTFTTDEPELIVRLYQGNEEGIEEVIAVFEVNQYEDRLHHMREIYENEMLKRKKTKGEESHAKKAHGGTPNGKADASWKRLARHADPWVTYSYRDVQHEVEGLQHDICEMKSRLMERDQQVSELVKVMEQHGIEVPNLENLSLRSLIPYAEGLQADKLTFAGMFRPVSSAASTTSGDGAARSLGGWTVERHGNKGNGAAWPPNDFQWTQWLASKQPYLREGRKNMGRAASPWRP